MTSTRFLFFFIVAMLVGCGDGETPATDAAAPAAESAASSESANGPAADDAETISLEVFPHGAALSPDGSRIAIAGGAEYGVWDLSSGEVVNDDFAPLTVESGVGSGEYTEALRTWWTTDDTVWFQFDLGIKGYDPETGAERVQAVFPALVGISSYDVAPNGSAVFMGQGMADFFVIHDVENDETHRIDYSIESPTGMVGARNASFTADGRIVAVGFQDQPRYFRRDGTEIEDPASEFSGTRYAEDVAEGRRFRFVAPEASGDCFDNGASIICDGGEVFTWSQQAPEGAEGRARARVVSADRSTAVDIFVSASGGSIVRVNRIE